PIHHHRRFIISCKLFTIAEAFASSFFLTQQPVQSPAINRGVVRDRVEHATAIEFPTHRRGRLKRRVTPAARERNVILTREISNRRFWGLVSRPHSTRVCKLPYPRSQAPLGNAFPRSSASPQTRMSVPPF